jgi:transcriptional regulator with XRE-family HTH domain
MKRRHNKAFGRALREIRKEHGHTQETLGFECGLDRTYISLLELGSSSPTLDTIMALCQALGISFSELATRVDSKLQKRKRSGNTAAGSAKP